jgi:VWFA-related protein
MPTRLLRLAAPPLLAAGILGPPGPEASGRVDVSAPPSAPPQEQQPQQPVFRGRLETVALPVTVVDPDGALVTALTRDDFMVFDNGKRQEITTFSAGLNPIRLIALVDVSASMVPAIDLALMAAEQLVIRLRPDDTARVGLFSQRVALSPHFTADRDALLATLRQDLPFSNPTKLFDAISTAVTALTPESGRRVVVVFTDGCDTASETTWSALQQRIYASDVLVYAMLFRPRLAVSAPPPRSLSMGAPSLRRGAPPGGPCTLHHHLELSPAVSPSDFFRVDDPRWTRGAQLVNVLTADTGGRSLSIQPTEDVNTLFTTLMKELHYLYLIGFTPQQLDGKVHELAVRVSDRSLIVRSRRHYLAPLPPSSLPDAPVPPHQNLRGGAAPGPGAAPRIAVPSQAGARSPSPAR